MRSTEPGTDGLPKRLLSHPSGSTAEIYRQGAQVTSWIPAGGEEALFLSKASCFAPGAAIRGGIPLIFPQFAALGPLPHHGFARHRVWEWVGAGTECPSVATLCLTDDEASRAVWPHAFAAQITVQLGADSLAVHLRVSNSGSVPFAFTAALHTYLRVADVRKIEVRGLSGVRYRSTPERVHDAPDAASALTVSGEVDRVYLDVPGSLELRDPGAKRSIRIAAVGFRDAVVWNPWSERAAALPDLAADEYLRMLCVESGQIAQPVHLAPGDTWAGEQRLEMAAL